MKSVSNDNKYIYKKRHNDAICIQCLNCQSFLKCLQCFDAVGWAAGRAYACKKTGKIMCLGQGPDLHMTQLMPLHSLSLAPVNPDWFYLPGFIFLVPTQPSSPGQNPTEP